MTLRIIYQQLGWDAKYTDEIRKLNNRIIVAVDSFNSKLHEGGQYDDIYPNLIKEFAFLLGESKYYGYSGWGKYYFPLKDFFKEGGEDIFHANIKNLTLLLEAARKPLVYYKIHYTFLLDETKRVFDITPIDVGYLFTGKTIIKKGAKELDEKLILEDLTWLAKYPNSKQLFENALKHYLLSRPKATIHVLPEKSLQKRFHGVSQSSEKWPD